MVAAVPQKQAGRRISPEGYGRRQSVFVEAEIGTTQDKQFLCADNRIVSAEHQSPAKQHEAQRGNCKNNKVL